MSYKKIIWIGFVLMLLLQLWAPASMIFNRESVLKNGKSFKFRTVPIDPNDPFRGKYIVLRFDENSCANKENRKWETGEDIFVQLATDTAGFAKIESIHKTKPDSGNDCIKATVDYVGYDSLKNIFIKWPFERFYMEESKAQGAEQAYLKSSAEPSQLSYALVKVKNGEAVLENVFINNKPIVTLIKK
jgi:uncharacterized membrane-anchored protein